LSVVLWFGLISVPARALLGDVTYDGSVGFADLQAIGAAIGASEWSGSPNWNPEADLNRDREVTVADLAIAGRSFGSSHNFHAPRPISNTFGVEGFGSALWIDACQDGQGRIHVAWVETGGVPGTTSGGRILYTRLDRYGNTLVDDLQLDSGAYVGYEGAAIACSATGDAHLIWQGRDGLYEARVDRWGYLVLARTKVDTDVSKWPALAMDSRGWAHAAYRRPSYYQTYAMLSPDGLVAARTEGAKNDASTYIRIAVDAYGAPHILRESADDTQLLYLRQAAGDQPGIPERAIAALGWAGSGTDAHMPAMALDSAGNAYVFFWPAISGSDRRGLYLEKVGRDGSSAIDNLRVWPGWQFDTSIGRPLLDIATDSAGNVHLVARGNFGRDPSPLTYGVLDPQGSELRAPRQVLYPSGPAHPQLMVDGEGDLHIVYRGMGNGYPPCPDGALCYQGTSFSAAAYERSRPDLGVDVAHLSWEPLVVRWGGQVKVTATFFNGGWVAAPASKARVALLLGQDQVAAEAEVDLPPLGTNKAHQVQVTLSLGQPPAGYETMQYGRLVLTADAAGVVAETTEDNNVVSAPVVLQPLPTTAGLFLIVQDDTETVLGREGAPVVAGTAHLSGPLSRDVTVAERITILGKDLPIGADWTSYTVSWSAAGYRSPAPATVRIRRDPTDPYRIEYDPSNTVLLRTDRWGALGGSVMAQGGGAISGAVVRATGQGLDLQTTTGADGSYSFNQLIPGSYDVRVSAAGYSRARATAQVASLAASSWNASLAATTSAYLHGQVANVNGTPIAGAVVSLSGGDSATTDGNGYYDLEVDIGGPGPVTRTLQVSASGYQAVSQNVSLTAGMETVADVELPYDPSMSTVSKAGGRATWEQDESSAGLLPDAPDDAGWGVRKLFEAFIDQFWPSYRVRVLWGCYEYEITARYTGSGPRFLQEVQLRLVPKTFEQHMVSGHGKIEVDGHGIGVEIGVLQDSGVLSALRVIEARLVDADSGTVLKTVRGFRDVLAEETRTYNFEGARIDDWDNAEVWVYYKVGKNQNGEWTGSPILQGWRLDQQVLRLNLKNGTVTVDYVLVDFPVP
jgi:hypothetical protein